jgi:hypothetical protein
LPAEQHPTDPRSCDQAKEERSIGHETRDRADEHDPIDRLGPGKGVDQSEVGPEGRPNDSKWSTADGIDDGIQLLHREAPNAQSPDIDGRRETRSRPVDGHRTAVQVGRHEHPFAGVAERTVHEECGRVTRPTDDSSRTPATTVNQPLGRSVETVASEQRQSRLLELASQVHVGDPNARSGVARYGLPLSR